MAHVRESPAIKLSPGQVQNRTILAIQTAAGNAGCIHECRAVTILEKAAPQTMAALEQMMHMSKNNQIRSALAGHRIKGQGQITVSPVDGRSLPVPAARTGGVRSKPCWTAVRQNDEGLILWDLLRCGDDASSRFLKSDRTKHRLHGFGEMKSATGAAGARSHNRKRWIGPGQSRPAAVAASKQGQLLSKQVSTAIPAPIMVPEDHREWKRQGGDPTRQPKVTVTEVSHKQHRIGLESLEELLIGITP